MRQHQTLQFLQMCQSDRKPSMISAESEHMCLYRGVVLANCSGSSWSQGDKRCCVVVGDYMGIYAS